MHTGGAAVGARAASGCVSAVAAVPEYSRSHLKTLIDEGCVQVNGQAATSASRKVLLGQVLNVLLKPTAQSQAFRTRADGPQYRV